MNVRGFARPLVVVCLLFATACGANVRGNVVADAAASLPDAAIGPVEGCPSSTGDGRGRWETIEFPPGFSARAMAKLVAFDRSLAVIGGYGERDTIEDHWIYEPASGRWTRLATPMITTVTRHLIVEWMPEVREFFVWIPLEFGGVRRGVRVALDGTTRAISMIDAPQTVVQRAVSVAGAVFVAGSTAEGDHNEFALYDPRRDRWEPVLAPREQNARGSFSLVANDRSVFIWGGADATFSTAPARDDGWRFDVVARRWASMTRTGAASPRFGHQALWIRDSMFVWGGSSGSRTPRSSARYFEGPDAWLSVSDLGAPGSVENMGSFSSWSAWTGGDVFVWTLTAAGEASAARWDPRSERWFAAAPPPRAELRDESSSAWVDCALYVVGGRTAAWRPREFARESLRWVP